MKDTAKNLFIDKLMDEIIANRKNDLSDNFDESIQYNSHYRAESNRTWRERVLDNYLPVYGYYPSKRHWLDVLRPNTFYRSIVKQLENVAPFYAMLNDDASKEWLIKILAYRILGFNKIKLPRNTPEYWQGLDKAHGLALAHGEIKANQNNFTLKLLDLSPIGFDIKLNMSPIGAAMIFMQRQYEYHQKTVSCQAETGDVVIDGGACWGDTALYFAHQVGDSGQVFAFEFIPENLAIINRNLNQNPQLKDRIHIVEHPMWRHSDQSLFYFDHGPGSSIGMTNGNHAEQKTCRTLSIDDLVMRKGLSKVDFIKMDIEGSELDALHGAEKTIRQFKPKLAISLYHKPEDFVAIPKFLNDLKLGYEFYLDHHTIHFWETVLFAIPRK